VSSRRSGTESQKGVCEHAIVKRSTLVVLIALGAAFAGFVIASVARDLRGSSASAETSAAAPPQTAALGWKEVYGSPGQKLLFRVDRLKVVQGGWSARIGMTNDTTTAYDVGGPEATLNRSFGLMLFSTNARSELDDRNRRGTLPPVREAVRFDPALPKVMEAGDSWEGTISGPGALAAGSWARVVFGALVVIGKPPSGAPSQIVWITDHAYKLRA
jgi:hypothetical protein